MEIILVDDASGDGTLQLLRELARGFGEPACVEVLALERNQGPSGARNAGWNAAAGKYVAFLDADASWHPRKLELQHRFMERHADVYISGHSRIVTRGRMDAAPVSDDPGASDLLFTNLLWGNPLAPSTVMVRNDRRFRFPEGQRRMEDHRLFLEMARAGERLALLDAPLAAHHKADFGAGGLSGDLVAMETAELGNYRALYRARAIGPARLAVLYAWSIAKFLRRVIIVAFRRLASPAR
jgi:glycosyltransferase involved in cell wall biosynthesis